ncbi:ABC transporter ATP-binding protein [Myxococcota bacterium]|nr:ABC transporter ATP-binding protein [Myxococcota bacterium]
MNNLLEVQDLTVTFDTPAGELCAVDRVSFSVARGATVGIVGESGSGKSVAALSLLGLTRHTARAVTGVVRFEGTDLLALSERELARHRGAKLSMVFQDPMASLNPAHRVGAQVAEPLAIHERLPKAELERRVLELFREVGIPDPAERMKAYPHQLSGGLRQRVMIAMALACGPALLVADEPTTALDVTIQAQIVELLDGLRRRRGMSVLLITHDLGLVAELCDRVIVMYAGRIVEEGPTAELLTRPGHPYTAGLLASTPVPGQHVDRLREIPGVVPDLRALPPGCRFQDRCPRREERCTREAPALVRISDGRSVACHFPLETTGASKEVVG